jgi:hypothetical protein
MADCPICAELLQQIDVAPCFDCGHSPEELGECIRGEHTYHEFEIWGSRIVLCDFCDADFGSYYPDYWGLPAGPLPDYPLVQVREIERPAIQRDLFCTSCRHRLAFLSFLTTQSRGPPWKHGLDSNDFQISSGASVPLFWLLGGITKKAK